MSSDNNFYAAYTATVEASAHDIWAIWADVNNWKKWDSGIANSEIRETFRAGNKYWLTPQGGDPIEITLKTVTQGEEFSDEAVLPFGIIRNVHSMQSKGKRLQITHKVYADINETAASFFSKEIWPHMQSGLAESVNKIISIAQN
jgi:hypothetical protein